MKKLSALWDAIVGNRRQPGMNVLRVASAVQDGETVTFGSNVFEVDYSTTASITAGRHRVNLSGSGTLAAASLTGTFSDVGNDGDTITIGGQVYRLKTAIAAINDVLIGATAADTRNNLVAAINAAAGAGTTYYTGTVANASVTAAASSTASVVLTAKAKGTVGNSIAVSEAGTHFSFAGGATALANGVDATAAEFTTALETAANLVGGIKATRISANEVLFVDYSGQTYGRPIACSDTLAGANNAWAAANTYGHTSPGAPGGFMMVSRVPNATEVAVGSLHFLLDFTPRFLMVQVNVTATGVVKAWDGQRSIPANGRRVTLTNQGDTDWAATDTVTIIAQA